MYLYACKKTSCGWIEAREESWGPDRCPDCGNWRVEVQQTEKDEPHMLMDDPDAFDSEPD